MNYSKLIDLAERCDKVIRSSKTKLSAEILKKYGFSNLMQVSKDSKIADKIATEFQAIIQKNEFDAKITQCAKIDRPPKEAYTITTDDNVEFDCYTWDLIEKIGYSVYGVKQARKMNAISYTMSKFGYMYNFKEAENYFKQTYN